MIYTSLNFDYLLSQHQSQFIKNSCIVYQYFIFLFQQFKFQKIISFNNKLGDLLITVIKQAIEQMSTNSLLLSLYNNSKVSPTSRSSSMFINKITSIPTENSIRDNKSYSVSKPLIKVDILNKNDAIKWTPLINTFNKLGSKLKKSYFFFWCRMQAHVKLKYLNNKNKQIVKQQVKQNIIKIKQNTQQITTLQQKKPYHHRKISQSIKFGQQRPNHNELTTEQLVNHCEKQKIQYQKLSQRRKYQKLSQTRQYSKLSQTTVSQSHFVLKSKQTILQEFVTNIKAIQNKYLQNYLKQKSFQSLIKRSKKLIAINKIKQICQIIKRKQSNRYGFKQIKSFSHWYSKVDIVFKLFHKIFKLRANQGFVNIKSRYTHQLNVQKTILKINQQKRLKLIQIQKSKTKQVEQIKQISFQIQRTKFMQLKNEKKLIDQKQKVYKQRIFKQNLQKLNRQSNLITNKIQRSTKIELKIAKAFRIPRLTTAICPKSFKQDEIISYKIPFQNINNQRMKKLSHLYCQQPIFEIPDISQITLFNSTINNKVMIKDLISEITQGEAQKTLNINFESVPQWIQNGLQNNKTLRYNQFNSVQLNKSPTPKTYDQSTQKFNKSSSYVNLLLTRRQSSNNIHKTPISTKKNITLLSKNGSIQNSYKHTKPFELLNSGCKSPVLDQWKYNGLCELKDQDKIKSSSKKILGLKRSTQKYCIDIVIPSSQLKKQVQLSKQNKEIAVKKQKETKKMHSIKQYQKNQQSQAKQNALKKACPSPLGHYNKSIKQLTQISQSSKRKLQVSQKTLKSYNKENLFASSSHKKSIVYKQLKTDYCSEFNDGTQLINIKLKGPNDKSYNIHNTINKTQRNHKRSALQDIDLNQPIFQNIQMMQHTYQDQPYHEEIQTEHIYLPTQGQKPTQPKLRKLRSKLDKVELNTARKIQLQIASMINQRKKSSIGLLKF